MTQKMNWAHSIHNAFLQYDWETNRTVCIFPTAFRRTVYSLWSHFLLFSMVVPSSDCLLPLSFFRSVSWYLEFRAALSILNAVPLITSIGLPNIRLTRGFLTLISTLPNRSSSTPMWKTKAARPRCFCFSIAVPILSV